MLRTVYVVLYIHTVYDAKDILYETDGKPNIKKDKEK